MLPGKAVQAKLMKGAVTQAQLFQESPGEVQSP